MIFLFFADFGGYAATLNGVIVRRIILEREVGLGSPQTSITVLSSELTQLQQHAQSSALANP